jgi:thiol-disulfide isomerase/thioredoxin
MSENLYISHVIKRFPMKLLITACLFCLFSAGIQAQQPAAVKKPTLADFTVKDSSGTVYPTNIVQSLMMSGKYSIRVIPGTMEAVLYELSDKEKSVREAYAPKPKESNFFKEGDVFPAFKERDMKGNRYNLKDLAGKVVVLNFWFINCPPCRREIPELNEVVDKYKENKDVVFLAIALDQRADLEDFLKTSPYKYNIVDDGRYTAQRYGINLYPTHVVIDKQGKILFHTSGFSSSTVPWIKKSIEAGLNNTVPK